MSIFGVKKQKAGGDIETLTSHVRDLHTRVRNQMEKRAIIPICAESKGALVKDEIFSFGNGGRTDQVGFVLTRRGQIIEMGLSCSRAGGDMTVGVNVDGYVLPFCETTVDKTTSIHEIFQTPFIVEAGSVINFVCKTGNVTAENTVATLLIELF